MSMRFSFQGRNAVVTGGAQGIGLSVVKQLLEAGARVSIWDYSEAALHAARDQLKQWEKLLHIANVDVGDYQACMAAAANLPFKIDILVNNAGITRDKSVAKMMPEEFEMVIKTNLCGSFFVVKALLSCFTPDNAEKRIINMASVVALYGNFGQTNYAAAKAGVVGMTKSLARELGGKGFTVNAIAPGFVDTQMVAAMPQDVRDRIAAKVPKGRLGQPEDIATTCLFLASEESSYINGAVLSVDGGLVV